MLYTLEISEVKTLLNSFMVTYLHLEVFKNLTL